MGRLLRFLIQLVVTALCFVLVTVILMIIDGLNDVGDKADVALVAGPNENVDGAVPRLDRVARLYKDGEFEHVMLSSFDDGGAEVAQVEATKYLEVHGVPSAAIMEIHARSTGEMASKVSEEMKAHELESVMIVTEYYRMSRQKLALLHAGVHEIAKSHVGSARTQDAMAVASEVVALYEYIGRTFLMPAAEKVKDEAAPIADKAKVEAEKAQKSISKDIDSLPK